MHALRLELEGSQLATSIDTPLGVRTMLTHICCGVSKIRSGRVFSCDMIVLDMSLFNIIWGMDCLSVYGATIDCDRRRVTLCHEPDVTVRFVVDRELPSSIVNPVRSTLNYLLASLSLSDVEKVILALHPIVSEFIDVFPENLSGLPSLREVEFVLVWFRARARYLCSISFNSERVGGDAFCNTLQF